MLLIALAFLVRLSAVAGLRDLHKFHGMQAGADAVEFNALGLNVAKGVGYAIEAGRPTSFRAPGYPLFLAALYSVSYENYFLVYLMQALLGAVTCGLTYGLAQQVLAERGARVSGLLAAAYFGSIYNGTLFLSEPLFSACLALGVLLFLQFLRTGAAFQVAGAGLALGAGTLVRPFAILMLPALAGVLAVRMWRTQGFRAAPLILFATTFLGVLVPWTMRNYSVQGKLVLLTTNGGSTFYGANNDTVLHDSDHRGGWISTVYLPGRDAVEATPDEVTHDRVEWQLGIQWVRQHLVEMPLLLIFKLVRFGLPDLSSGNRKYVLLNILGYGPFLVLFVIAFFRCVRTRDCWSAPWMTLHLTMAVAVITALVFWGSPRFRDGNFPVLMVYAGLLWNKPSESAGKRLAEPAC